MAGQAEVIGTSHIRHEEDLRAIKALQDEIKRLHGEAAKSGAQSATIESLQGRGADDRKAIADQKTEISLQKAEIAQLNIQLQAALAKQVRTRWFVTNTKEGWWPKKHRQIALCVVLHGNDVIDVKGEISEIECFDIPPELKKLIRRFLSVTGTVPELKLLKSA